jgi:hypothetical protein
LAAVGGSDGVCRKWHEALGVGQRQLSVLDTIGLKEDRTSYLSINQAF